MRHARDSNELLEVASDELRPVVRDDPRLCRRVTATTSASSIMNVSRVGEDRDRRRARRTKSTIWSRTSCGTQLPVRVPQVFFLARRAPPSTRPGPRPWSAPSSPRTKSVSTFPPPGGGDAPALERQPLRSRRTPFANGRTPSASSSVLHTGPKPGPCPKDAAAKPQPFLQGCSSSVKIMERMYEKGTKACLASAGNGETAWYPSRHSPLTPLHRFVCQRL